MAHELKTGQSIGHAMKSKIFVNLPVMDLNRSIAFFQTLGFTFNPKFTDDTAACMVITDDIFAMLLTEAKFQSFTTKSIVDATKQTEVLVALSCDSSDRVKQLVATALESGGTSYSEPKDFGFMYLHGFQDPDGHIWELFFMDPSAVPN